MRPLPEVLAEATARMPAVTLQRMAGASRWNIIDPLPATGSVGIELGVASGSFSARMVGSGKFRLFFGVDAYGDGHGVGEYKTALRACGLWSDYRLLRMTFAQALDLFEDGSLDFIYIDGFAHTGCEGGRTLEDWYPKLRPGGIMAGDDYHPTDWPLVVWAAHEAAAQLGVPLAIADQVLDEPYNRYPSWSFTRPEEGPAKLGFSARFREIADSEKVRIDALRRQKRLEKQAATRQR